MSAPSTASRVTQSRSRRPNQDQDQSALHQEVATLGSRADKDAQAPTLPIPAASPLPDTPRVCWHGITTRVLPASLIEPDQPADPDELKGLPCQRAMAPDAAAAHPTATPHQEWRRRVAVAAEGAQWITPPLPEPLNAPVLMNCVPPAARTSGSSTPPDYAW